MDVEAVAVAKLDNDDLAGRLNEIAIDVRHFDMSMRRALLIEAARRLRIATA